MPTDPWQFNRPDEDTDPEGAEPAEPADQVTHAFATFMGLPPDTSDRPVCGAPITPAYDFPGYARPTCGDCAELMGAR